MLMSLHAYACLYAVYSIFKQVQGSNNFTPPRYRRSSWSVLNASWFEQEFHFKDGEVNSIYLQPLHSRAKC